MIPGTMTAVHLTGHGGLEKLVIRHDIAVPTPGERQVLVRVTAAGVNNTDINTRTGWYGIGMGDWEGGLTFPRIQGADAVGYIVAVGNGVNSDRIGERVVCDPYIRDPNNIEGFESAGFLGSEYDGAFAQYMVLPSVNALTVPKELSVSDAALATLPCSGGTAMNMLILASAKAGDLALVTGASGGVGTFLVQLLSALGAEVIAIAGKTKMEAVATLGADHVIERESGDLIERVLHATGGRKLSLVADVVGGSQFSGLLKLLKRGGRYIAAGAIGGPKVELDLRTLYLKNLSLFGSAVYLRETLPRLIDLVIAGRITPFGTQTWPLTEIRSAQTEFLQKKHVGSLVLLPVQ